MCRQGRCELCRQGRRGLWQQRTKIVPREESTDLGVQNSWCTELLVHTIIPPTCSKNNKGAPSARPTGARTAPVVAVFATCWWNYGVHQEFCAPRILYTKICALLSGHTFCAQIAPGDSLSDQIAPGDSFLRSNCPRAPWRRSWTPSACQGLSSTAPAHKIKPRGNSKATS